MTMIVGGGLCGILTSVIGIALCNYRGGFTLTCKDSTYLYGILFGCVGTLLDYIYTLSGL